MLAIGSVARASRPASHDERAAPVTPVRLRLQPVGTVGFDASACEASGAGLCPTGSLADLLNQAATLRLHITRGWDRCSARCVDRERTTSAPPAHRPRLPSRL